MKTALTAAVFGLGYLAAHLTAPTTAAGPEPAPPPADELANPAIDMDGFIKVAQEAARHRATRRVTEAEFIRMSGEKGTVVLDARSKQMFDRLHVKGAINLNFSDLDAVQLAKVLPDKNARILIYCNNNFTPAADAPARGSPNSTPRSATAAAAREAFLPKKATASLNVSTYTALYNYGYRNVYELAPLIDPSDAKIEFESTPAG